MSLSRRSSGPASARSSSSRPGPRLPKQRPGRAGSRRGSKLARVRQIADRIPKAYKQENGEQLTVSQASQLAVPTEGATCRSRRSSSVPTRLAASRRRATSMPTAAPTPFPTGSAAWERRAVRDQPGQPSGERFTLLSRQALELSLYTFKYVRRRRLGGRVHAADAEGREQRLDVPAPWRRRRRAPPADLSASSRDGAARGGLSEIELGNIAETDPAANLRLRVPGGVRRQADPRSHPAHRRLLIRSSIAG